MARFKALNLLGKVLKRKAERKDTSERSPRGFTFSSMWRRKKASPTDGPRPKRSWVLKVISSVSKKFKAKKPEAADNGDDKDGEPPVEQGLQLQYDEVTTSSYNVTEHDVCDSSLSEFIPTECVRPLVDQQEVNEVVTQDREEVTQVSETDDELEVASDEGEDRKGVDQEQITWEGDVVGQGNDVGLGDDVGRDDDGGDAGRIDGVGLVSDVGWVDVGWVDVGRVYDAGRDDGVLIWKWMYIITVAVIFVLLLYYFN